MSSAKRTVLGRALADLIPVGGSVAALDPITGRPLPPAEVPIAQVHPNPTQPRTHFDESAMAELAESIEQHGILQPILVRPCPSGGYEIVAGERRYRAAVRVGRTTVPVVVRTLSDEDTLALALIENLIREDIGPLETARAFRRLMDDYGWTQEQMGQKVGKSRAAVTNSLRLLHLPEPIQRSLEAGEVSEGHARALLGDEKSRSNPAFRERQNRVWRQAVEKRLSVRDVERMMRASSDGSAAAPGATPTMRRSGVDDVSRETSLPGEEAGAAAPTGMPLEELRALEDRLREALGTRVELLGSADKGRIVIEFYSPDQFDGLLARLEGRPEEGVSEETADSADAIISPVEEEPTPPAEPPAGRRPKRGSDPIQGLLSSRLSPR